MNQLKQVDIFELDRILEDIAKTFAAPTSTAWFKANNNRKPSRNEYYEKTVEFIKKFENLLMTSFPDNEHSDYMKGCISENIDRVICSVHSGNNKEVDKRYRYYVDYY